MRGINNNRDHPKKRGPERGERPRNRREDPA